MEKISFEIEILAKDYSSFRGGSKWRSYRSQSIPLEKPISTDGTMVKIYRPSLEVVDYYPIPYLIKRLDIKRSPIFFQFFQKLWQFINPSSMRSISKSVYTVVVESFYAQFQQSMANPSIVNINLSQDIEIDFKGILGVTFAEFYDIIFDITDSLAKSTLISEYSRIVFSTMQLIEESSTLAGINLHGKLHLKEAPRVSYYKWMLKLLRDKTPQPRTTNLPEIFRNVSSKNLAPKFLNRIKTKIIKDEDPVKWSMKQLIENNKRSKTPVRTITPKIEKKKASNSFKRLEIERKNPLSITPRKDRKKTHLLEDIIEERTGKILRDHF